MKIVGLTGCGYCQAAPPEHYVQDSEISLASVINLIRQQHPERKFLSEIQGRFNRESERQPLLEGLRSAERLFSVSPNPFTDQIGIRINTEQEGDFVFTLYDTNGKIVAQRTYVASIGSNEWSLSLDRDVPTGTYALVMTDKKGKIDSCLLVKVQ